jgi:hypothetical protein
MADNPETSEPFSLKRWSQRKRAAARTAPADPIAPPATESIVPATTVAAETSPAPIVDSAPLPPVDSLTFDSDYSAFMQPKIAEETRRAALRKLFSDPSFNVMDGLDIYVGDYTQADPMPAGMLDKLSAVYAMLDPVEPALNEPGVAPAPETTDAIAAAVVVGDSGGAATAAPPALPAGAPTAPAAEEAADPPPGSRKE